MTASCQAIEVPGHRPTNARSVNRPFIARPTTPPPPVRQAAWDEAERLSFETSFRFKNRKGEWCNQESRSLVGEVLDRYRRMLRP
jgi:hypothetical protein